MFTGNTADNGACTINLAEKSYGPIAATITDNTFGTGTKARPLRRHRQGPPPSRSPPSPATRFTDGTAFKVTSG